MNNTGENNSLPPIIPNTYDELQQAICLLGNRSKTQLGKKPKKQLIELIGVYPDAATATLWKQTLRQKVKELNQSSGELIQSRQKDKKRVLKTRTAQTSNVSTNLNEPTKIMLSWVVGALAEEYLDDEDCYDPVFVFQMQAWWKETKRMKKLGMRNAEFGKQNLNSEFRIPNSEFRGKVIPEVYLAKKFVAANIARARAEDIFEFDISNFDFDLDKDKISIGEKAPSFVESLLRQSLSQVDWKILGDYLVKNLNLND